MQAAKYVAYIYTLENHRFKKATLKNRGQSREHMGSLTTKFYLATYVHLVIANYNLLKSNLKKLYSFGGTLALYL